MQEKLIIYLHAHSPTNPDWLIINEEGVCSGQVTRGEPVELAGYAKNRHVIVIVPAESILLTSVVLPKMNRQCLLKAVPYALEEQLVDDVEKLHFATADFNEQGELAVAIISHASMQQWLDLLREWQVKPDAIVPMTSTIPIEEDTLHVFVDYMAEVRTDIYAGFACDTQNLMSCLNLAFTDENRMPSTICIHNATSEPCADQLRVTAKVLEDFVTPDQLLVTMAQTVTSTPYINLLQGVYATKQSRLPQTQRMLRGIMVLAASWVALLFLYPVVSYFILGGKLSQIDSEIAHIYKLNFPQASSMVAPKIRMEDKLRQLEGQAGENKLLLLLGYAGEGLANATNVKLKRVDYQGGMLTMELSAASSDDFSSFADYLTSAGLNVKQENATLSGSRVNATLQVE